jgi:hypothetical protein
MENEVEGMAAFLEGRGKGKLAEDLRQRGQDMSDIMLSYGALRTVLLKTKRKAPRKGKVGARVGAASGGRK